MSYLLDTNVVSELARAKPSREVTAWFAQTPNDVLFLSALSLGEIRHGVERLPDQQRARRERLRLWLERDLTGWFGARILSVDHEVADRWGRLLAEVGRPVATVDSLLAATALHHRLRLVTRNTKDFDYPGLQVVDPWQLDK